MSDEINFGPLTEEERSACETEHVETKADEGKPACKPPADAEPVETAAVRLFRRKPAKIWTYRDVDGATLSHVARFNLAKGEKAILPLTWADGEGWRLRQWLAPRPLYNLDTLAAQPNAPVVIVEGEKAADAAARIFPESIISTSSGGANAFAKTDWQPLAGRRVMIWPDHDEAGAKYAHAVAAILADLGAEVSILDAAALIAKLNPRQTNGFDAADALDETTDVNSLRQLAESLAELFEPGPEYRTFKPYRMDAEGLTVERERGRGDEKEIVEVWISAPFEIIGACRDARGEAWGKVLRWRDGDARQHVRLVAEADLQGEPRAICSRLADAGLRINPTEQRTLLKYIGTARVRRRVRLVSRTGWHEIEGRSVFVLPVESIGPSGAERVILDAAANAPYHARGTVEDWREGVARLAGGHALPVLAISAALAGPLLQMAGMEGGGLHFWGHSSKGKTTLLQMAASVWGPGGSGGYVRTWRATANGLEGAAASATDTALILDEIGQVDGREVGVVVYALANGVGKARSARDGGLREPKTWRVVIISNGEIPIGAKLAEDRQRMARAGQMVRMLDISAERVHGVFDNPVPGGDAAAFSNKCKLAAASTYGTAGPAFVRRLIAEGVSGDDVRGVVRSFVSAHVPQGADGQIERAAERLGLFAAAGEFATHFGQTGWQEGEARGAAAWALSQWIEGRGGTEPAEVSQAIATVRRFIEAHGEARFDNLDDPEARPVVNRAGWRQGTGEGRRWFVPSETWRAEICAGLDAGGVAKILAERGMLERASDGLQLVKRIEGRPQRVRVITPRIFDGGKA